MPAHVRPGRTSAPETGYPGMVTSNGVPISFDDGYFAPLPDSTSLLSHPAKLRHRLTEDGYLYLRGVLNPAAVWDLRAAYFAGFGAEYFAPGTTPAAGVSVGSSPPRLPPHGHPGHPAHEFVRSAVFDRFLTDPALTRLAEAVLGGPVTQLPRRILRHFRRGSALASRAHIDHDYMACSSDRAATVWIPVGDCPLLTGGLIYLERSHTARPAELECLREVTDRPADPRPLSHDLAWTARQLGRRWLWTDYAAGDLTVHVPRTVHASLDTMTDTMRLSIDVRYVRCGEPADQRWTRPWSGDDGN